RLCPPRVGQGNVRRALPAADPIPFGLAVPGEVDGARVSRQGATSYQPPAAAASAGSVELPVRSMKGPVPSGRRGPRALPARAVVAGLVAGAGRAAGVAVVLVGLQVHAVPRRAARVAGRADAGAGAADLGAGR